MRQYKEYQKVGIDFLTRKSRRTFLLADDMGLGKTVEVIGALNVLKPKSIKANKKVRALTVEEQQIFSKFLFNTTIQRCKYKNVFFKEVLQISKFITFCSLSINLIVSE